MTVENASGDSANGSLDLSMTATDRALTLTSASFSDSVATSGRSGYAAERAFATVAP